MGSKKDTPQEAVHVLHPKKLFHYISEEKEHVTMHDYCRELIGLRFHGQTSVGKKMDKGVKLDDVNLGTCMAEFDAFLRKFPDFNVEENEEYCRIIELISRYRYQNGESYEECHERLMRDGKRFLEIYKQRKVLSERLEHTEYWGTRQQLLSGKVIADWLDVTYGAMDPVFGALLNPTTGRVGPSDSTVAHGFLFDEDGRFAYHSAVHDAFGYLITAHGIGPGYDYLQVKTLGKNNIFAGQYSGLNFWKKAVRKYIRKSRKTKILKFA